MFRDEFECLEIRLHELEEIVDCFVLVQADFTFQGNARTLQYDNRFPDFPLVVVDVTDDEGVVDPWHREALVRNAVLRGLGDADPDDVALLSDVDEIPRREAVQRACTRVHNGSAQVALEQQLCFYHANAVASTPWFGTQVCNVEWMQKVKPDEVRRHRDLAEDEPNGGTHLCNMGGPAWLIEKIESFSHTEVNLPQWKDPELLARCIAEHREMTGRPDLRFEVRDDVWVPEYLTRERFPHFFAEIPA